MHDRLQSDKSLVKFCVQSHRNTRHRSHGRRTVPFAYVVGVRTNFYGRTLVSCRPRWPYSGLSEQQSRYLIGFFLNMKLTIVPQ